MTQLTFVLPSRFVLVSIGVASAEREPQVREARLGGANRNEYKPRWQNKCKKFLFAVFLLGLPTTIRSAIHYRCHNQWGLLSACVRFAAGQISGDLRTNA